MRIPVSYDRSPRGRGATIKQRLVGEEL